MRLVITAAAVVLFAATGTAQPAPIRATEAQAREWATAAAATARGKQLAFFKAFDKSASAVVKGFKQGHVILNRPGVGNQNLRYIVAHARGQLQAFEYLAYEATRQGKPVSEAPWPKGPVVWVEVNDDESPAVERAIVRRGNDVIPAVENHIEAGHSRSKNIDSYEGWAVLPLEAFAPTKEIVQIELIPRPSKYGKWNSVTRIGGKNLEKLYRF